MLRHVENGHISFHNMEAFYDAMRLAFGSRLKGMQKGPCEDCAKMVNFVARLQCEATHGDWSEEEAERRFRKGLKEAVESQLLSEGLKPSKEVIEKMKRFGEGATDRA